MEKWPQNAPERGDQNQRKNAELIWVKCYVCNGTGAKDGKSCRECQGKGKVQIKS